MKNRESQKVFKIVSSPYGGLVPKSSLRNTPVCGQIGLQCLSVAVVMSSDIYIQSATLNGKPYTRNYITHQDIVNGGVMEFVMGDEPNKEWGAGAENCPPEVM